MYIYFQKYWFWYNSQDFIAVFPFSELTNVTFSYRMYLRIFTHLIEGQSGQIRDTQKNGAKVRHTKNIFNCILIRMALRLFFNEYIGLFTTYTNTLKI